MELKYTLEILTKDIQDIEKLVGNLQNSPQGSTLELDLALSKLRNVYDILTVIRADMETEILKRREAEPKPETEPEPKPETAPEPAKKPAEVKETQKKSTGILAEKFSAESRINENLGGNRDTGVDSKVVGKPIDNIGRNIGINDRFLITRELFENNAENFNQFIEQLDKSSSIEEANRLMEEQFDSSNAHEGIAVLHNLIRRRFI